MILVGVTPAIEAIGAVVAALLVACLRLTHQGRGLEPRSPTGRNASVGGPRASGSAAAKALSQELGPKSANVTGANYVIDGGLIKTM